MSYERRGNYIVATNTPRRAAGITGRDGQRVYRAGCNLEAAMHPTTPEKIDPTAQLLRDLAAQKRARSMK